MTSATNASGKPHYDINAVKQAARGRWPEILAAVGGLAQEFIHFDKREGPCPRCGGHTRFRGIDEPAGALHCSHCHNGDTNPRSGDGLSAVQWLRGWDFLTAAREIAQYVGYSSGSNGSHESSKPASTHGNSNGSVADLLAKVQILPASPESVASFVSGWCDKKQPIKPYGGQFALWPAKANLADRQKVLAFRGRHVGRDGHAAAILLYRIDGGLFPAFKGLQERKTHLVGGSDESWLWPGTSNDLKAAEALLVCEGLPDALAATSVGLLDRMVAITNACGAKSINLDFSIGAGKIILVCGDADKPGQEGAIAKAAGFSRAEAQEVRLVTLPYPVVEDHGRDLRDYLGEGGSLMELLDKSQRITEADLPPKQHWDSPSRERGKAKAGKPAATYRVVEPGTVLKCLDRDNLGTVVEDRGETCLMHFDGEDGQADVPLDKALLALQDGTPLAESTDIQIPPPCTLRELVSLHPTLRPAVIEGLLRTGETMNLVAAAKAKKSWLVNSLAFSVTAGRDWLEKFRCSPGRVLILDAELHPEVIAHRLPIVAEALGMEQGYDELIDIEALRGMGVDLFNMAPFIRSIEPGRYSLVILDAWYRFLPPGISENDNAAVMSLYNRIDAYASHLGAAWVNVHHASKGDQSGKSATDVGSGAGSQSRAADTHLIVRPHQEDNVAVVEAVVRSWPPVERFCIRWEYPAWQLDPEADPRKLWATPSARERAKESRDAHLEEDRQAIVSAMLKAAEPQTKTFIRDSSVGNPRFGIAWASLITDKTVVSAGTIRKGNNRPYEGFVLAGGEIDH